MAGSRADGVDWEPIVFACGDLSARPTSMASILSIPVHNPSLFTDLQARI